MKYAELQLKYNEVLQLIFNRKIIQASERMAEMLKYCRNQDLNLTLEHNLDTYRNILKYTFEYAKDPERDKIYKKLIRSFFELADDIKQEIIQVHDLLFFTSRKQTYGEQRPLQNIDLDKVFKEVELTSHFKSVLLESESPDVSGDQKIEEKSFDQYFEIFWLTDKFKDKEKAFFQRFISNKDIRREDKAAIVSAVTMSLFRNFDNEKMNVLFDFVAEKEFLVWQRALIGLVLSFHFYDRRLTYYPEILARLKTLNGDKEIEKMVEMIIIQFIRTKDTEKVTKRIQEEILPDLIKMKSHIEDKLDLKNILSSGEPEEKNPEWKTVFKDTPDLYKKMEEFSNLQLEGADVFMGTFSMLKFFRFFNELRNWFLPFYKENSAISNSFQDFGDKSNATGLLEGIEKTGFMCNSDKYSFCLNIKNLPIQQKEMMKEMFAQEMKAMNEIARDDELINSTARNKYVISQYFQDLYRFFKLHPNRHHFSDIFSLSSSLHNAEFFKILIEDKTVLRNIGEFFFEKEHYIEAKSVFLEVQDRENFELFEKIGYCYLKTGDHNKALEFFKKAELMEQNPEWILKKIALCYRNTGNYKEAVIYYKQAEKLDPQNKYTQTSLGNLLMEMKEYEEALKYYFKLEYLDENNYKVHRPIAWCSFHVGKLDVAIKYFQKVIEKEPTKNDYLNLGHIAWCQGDKKEAYSKYRKAFQLSNKDIKWITTCFEEDRKYLINYGVDPLDITLMIDYLQVE